MNDALQKTLELLLIILIGFLLQKKLPNKQSLGGLKILILSVALPATIFLALLKINLQTSLLFLPVLALAFNLLMFGTSGYLLPYFIKAKSEAEHRTRRLLLPSLAPGLSCFPFVIAYLGEDQLAIAALADVGNKFFGLILLFIIATYWYQLRAIQKKASSTGQRLKSLLLSLASEPINLVILLALILLGCGFTISAFPLAVQSVINKLSLMMVPLILLFIGLSIRISWSDFVMLLKLLSWRSGVAFLFASLFLLFVPGLATPMMILLLVFPQSSCSFWPFAHMCAVGNMEDRDGQNQPTFDQDFAIKVLACSLPSSTVMIISIFYFGEFFMQPAFSFSIGAILVTATMLPRLIGYFNKQIFNKSLDGSVSEV